MEEQKENIVEEQDEERKPLAEWEREATLWALETLLNSLVADLIEQHPDSSDEEIVDFVVDCVCLSMRGLFHKMLGLLKDSMTTLVREQMKEAKEREEQEKAEETETNESEA